MSELITLEDRVLSDKDLKHLQDFKCSDDRVNNFLKNESLVMQEHSMASTRLFFNLDNVLVGYYTIFNDIVQRINKQKLVKENWDLEVSEYYPAIRLHYIGVDEKYKNQKIGYTMLMDVFDKSESIAQLSGCTFITLESYEKSIGFYEKQGFRNIGRRDRDRYIMLFKIDELVS